MFGLKVATFPRAYKSDVATLKSNVTTFQGGLQLTSRRYKKGSNGDQPTSRRSGSTSRCDRGLCFLGAFNAVTL